MDGDSLVVIMLMGARRRDKGGFPANEVVVAFR